jgi:hypothetical protein
MQTSGRGELLNKRFGLKDPSTLIAAFPGDRPITFSHLRMDSPGQALASIPAESAYSIHVHLRQNTLFAVREEGSRSRKTCSKAGSLCFFYLRSPPQIFFDTPFQTIRSYVPFLALQEFAREAGSRRQVVLRPPSYGADDPIIRHLLRVCIPPWNGPRRGTLSSLTTSHWRSRLTSCSDMQRSSFRQSAVAWLPGRSGAPRKRCTPASTGTSPSHSWQANAAYPAATSPEHSNK